jgi:CheY-like chemotaxis protein
MGVNTNGRKTVLVVDDDATLREMLRIGIEKVRELKCITASNGIEGLEKVRNNRVDLLITDLQMPYMDGITFLSHMMEEFPHIPRAVMTSMGEAPQQYVKQTGVVAVLPKPVDINGIGLKILQWIDSYLPHTYTEGVDLSSLLQLVALDQKTCTVGVQDKQNGRIGLIHIHDGEMVDACAGNLTGIDAAMHILLWKDVRIWIHDMAAPAEVRIDTPMQAILMNAALARDEGNETEAEESEIPSAKWIREHRPEEVNINEPVHSPTTETRVMEQSGEQSSVPFLSRENRFIKEVAEALDKSQVEADELDTLFDQAISAFREKNYELSREMWLKAKELAPDHPVIKQNLNILKKYLPQDDEET